jgi:hypothetical protein
MKVDDFGRGVLRQKSGCVAEINRGSVRFKCAAGAVWRAGVRLYALGVDSRFDFTRSYWLKAD